MSSLDRRVRRTIVEALEDVDALGDIAPTLVLGFEEGTGDVSLEELALASLTRMELLVALEMEYAAVLSPGVFAEFRSLNDVVAWVMQSVPEHGSATDRGEASAAPVPAAPVAGPATTAERSLPRIARLFRRGLRRCGTVAEMNRLLTLMADRMTPLEATALREAEQAGQLLPEGAEPKFEAALRDWSDRFDKGLRRSGKAEPEPYEWRRISPAVVHYFGPGDRAGKTLLICFSVMGNRTLSIGQAIFLQHIDARAHDVLIISDIAGTAFRSGVPFMGSNVHGVVRWVAGLGLLKEYAHLRCAGCSAGVYPAMLTGRRIGAEVTVGLNGRFPSERYFLTLAKMYVNSWISSLRHRKARVLLVHQSAMRRDATYSRRLSWLTGASQLAVELPARDHEPNVLPPLVRHNELELFLDRTLLAPIDSALFAEARTATTLRFPLAPLSAQ